jgi:hypothetical protein
LQDDNLAASCHEQAVDNLSTSWEQALRAHPVDKLLEQHWYKSAADLETCSSQILNNLNWPTLEDRRELKQKSCPMFKIL